MNSLALIGDEKNHDEKNKLIEFCRYENTSLDFFLAEKNFKKITDFIIKNNISRMFLTEPKVLDGDLKNFSQKMIVLTKLNILVLCSSYDFPDPFQLAIRTLNFNGKRPERFNKIKESVSKKASRGQVLGRVPYGYDKNQSGFFIENLNASENIRKIFSMFIENIPISEICRELQNTSYNENWSHQKITHILKNDFYTGIYRRYNVVIPNSHKSIINKSDFERAKNIIDNLKTRNYKKNFWNGLLFCKVCEKKLYVSNHKNSWISKGLRKFNNYKYYNCDHRDVEDVNEKRLKIKFEKLNELLENKIDKNKLELEIFDQSYIYKLVAQLSNAKILMEEFIEKFERFNIKSAHTHSMINKIYVKETDNEIIINT